MKCHQCRKEMEYGKRWIRFNGYNIDGWKCKCGESYTDTEQTEMILLLNKLKKSNIKAKLGKIRSNLILRIPRDVETVLGFKEGEEVILKIENNELKVIPA